VILVFNIRTITGLKNEGIQDWWECSMQAHERMEVYKKLQSENNNRVEGLGDLVIDGRIILKRILKGIKYEDVNWIQLAEDRDHIRSLLNTILNIRIK
jgi:hypothetical protein